MNKVIIEITAESSITTLYLNGKKYIDKWVPTSSGASTEIQEIEDSEEVDETLKDSLTGFMQSDVMSALADLNY